MALDKQKISKKWIIGKNDIADLPLYNLKHVNIKIDSGAYTSTIHCKEINLVNNQLQVVFLDENQKGYTGEKFIFDSFKQKKVRSSSGELQNRYIVEGNIRLFGRIYTTEFTLSKRDLMKNPVLLGRKLLSHNFLIDTALTLQSYTFKKNNKT